MDLILFVGTLLPRCLATRRDRDMVVLLVSRTVGDEIERLAGTLALQLEPVHRFATLVHDVGGSARPVRVEVWPGPRELSAALARAYIRLERPIPAVGADFEAPDARLPELFSRELLRGSFLCEDTAGGAEEYTLTTLLHDSFDDHALRRWNDSGDPVPAYTLTELAELHELAVRLCR